MAFITGALLVDVHNAALNRGRPSQRQQNVSPVKSFYSPTGQRYAYVSAQAYRRALRNTLTDRNDDYVPSTWQIGSGKQQSFSAANPFLHADDDLFGYMRAIKGGNETVARQSVFRNSHLIAVQPGGISSDFGTNAQVQEQLGGSVIFEKEYVTGVFGLQFSLDLSQLGVFTIELTGGKANVVVDGQMKLTMAEIASSAIKAEATFDADRKAFVLPTFERVKRTEMLLRVMGNLEWTANMTLGLTSAAPVVAIVAVVRHGNPILSPWILFGEDQESQLAFHRHALEQIWATHGNDILALHVSRAEGFMDRLRGELASFGNGNHLPAPRAMFDSLASDVGSHGDWFA